MEDGTSARKWKLKNTIEARQMNGMKKKVTEPGKGGILNVKDTFKAKREKSTITLHQKTKRKKRKNNKK